MKAAYTICVALLLLLAPLFGSAQEKTPSDVESLLNRIETAYSAVVNYQVNAEVRNYRPGANFETKKFLYTYEKEPRRIRIDFAQPDPGMVIVYPDKNGQAVVQPFKLAKFIKLHLPPNSSILKDTSGQTIDRTDMGTLIHNMSRSLTADRRGMVRIDAKDGHIEIGVLAADHFRPGVTTRYLFIIDKKSWLPAGVEEWAPDNTHRRSIYFRNLRINIDLPDGFFNLNGG
jgi:outer membrane lipoprotein-sorting protein